MVDYIKQSRATRATEVQKYTTNVSEGVITMMPSMDTFHDTSKLPKLMVDNSDIYSAALIISDVQKQSAMGTVWTEWETLGGLPNDRVNQFGKEFTNKKLYNIQDASQVSSAGKIGIANDNLVC